MTTPALPAAVRERPDRPETSTSPVVPENLVVGPFSPGPQQAVTWQVAPEDRERYDRWLRCQFDWLSALERRSNASNTRRAYARDVVDFFAAFAEERLLPWAVTAVHAEAWVQALRGRGLADSTINRKVAALASLYRYAASDAIYTDASGVRAALWPWPNPFSGRGLRVQVSPYARAAYPTSGQVTALLAAIDLTTLTGLRNMALLAGLFATTRRVSEWLGLRGRDLHRDAAGGYWFEYRYKGGSPRRQAIPADIMRTIEAYLRADNRWPLAPEDYLFRATTAAGSRLRRADGAAQVRPGYRPDRQPLSASYVNRLIRRYGAQAGIPPERLHAHALRHAGARWRKDHGADVWQLRETLGHTNIAVTQVYTDSALDEPQDAYADTIGELLPRQLKLIWRD